MGVELAAQGQGPLVWQRSSRRRELGEEHGEGDGQREEEAYRSGTQQEGDGGWRNQETRKQEEQRKDGPSSWDKAAKQKEQQRDLKGHEQSRWGRQGEQHEKQQEDEQQEKYQTGHPNKVNEGPTRQNNLGCTHFGLKNHRTEECQKKKACEMCVLHSYDSYDYRREPLWNLGPELCAAQVHDQSFFYMDEHTDLRASREKASTTIITVIASELSARQIEQEFHNIPSSQHTWKWIAKKLAEHKFLMRFPKAKLVQDFSKFNMGIKSANAQITAEPWSSSIGAKGRLQQAWFRVKGIP